MKTASRMSSSEIGDTRAAQHITAQARGRPYDRDFEVAEALTPQRPSEVESEMRDYALGIDRMQKVVDALTERLSSVARPFPVNPVGIAEKPEKPLVPLAQQLRCRNHELAEYTSRLESLLSSIEL